jgi:hypothetical protein
MLNDSARNAGATAANAGITIIAAKNPQCHSPRTLSMRTNTHKVSAQAIICVIRRSGERRWRL